MQNTAFPTAIHDEEDNVRPLETTPLVSHSKISRRPRSSTNTIQYSVKRLLRSKTHLRKPVEKAESYGAVGNPNGGTSPSNQSYSTLVSCGAGRDVSPGRQLSCGPSQTESERSLSPPPRECRESLLSSISLMLENQGSVARDHLASERTFLAYVRTSLSIASSGVALVQLFTVASANLHHYPEHRIHTYIRPLGAATIVMGFIVLIIGVVRYFSVQAALTKGHFPAARLVTSFITLILLLLIVFMFGILVAGKLEPPSNDEPDDILLKPLLI